MNRTIFVVLGVDSHLQRIEKCISTIKAVYGDTIDIGVSTFGNGTVKPSVGLSKFSAERGFAFHDSERQNFIETSTEATPNSSQPEEVQASSREFHVCELLGNIAVSKHFYDLGYEEVFLLHSDLYVVRDFLPLYRKYMTDKWGFVSAYLSNPSMPKPPLDELSSATDLSNGDIVVDGNVVWVRMAQAVLILNKDLVRTLFEKYGTQKEIFENVLEGYSLYGDIALAQITTGLEGFSGNPVIEDTMVDPAALEDVSEARIVADPNITHIHGMYLFEKYSSSIDEIIDKIKAWG